MANPKTDNVKGFHHEIYPAIIPIAIILLLLEPVAPRLHAAIRTCATWSNAHAFAVNGSLSFESSGTFSGGLLDIRVLATAAYQQAPIMLNVSPAQFGQEYM